MAAQWLTLAQLRADWASCPTDNAVAERYLAAAKTKVLDYAPEKYSAPDLETVPENLLLAQQAMTRDLWNALHSKVSTPNETGLDPYTVTTFPMSWHIKELIRPNSPRPKTMVG